MAVEWKVREAAIARGVPSATKLAALAGLNKNTANDLWNGTPLRVDRSTLAKLCAALGCSLADLMEYHEGKTKPAASLIAAF
jgi:DNA-binding Xre family transcriptional regulator